MIKKWSHKKALKWASSMDMKVKRREGRCVEGKEGDKLSFWWSCFPHPPSSDVCSAKNICASDEEQRQKEK